MGIRLTEHRSVTIRQQPAGIEPPGDDLLYVDEALFTALRNIEPKQFKKGVYAYTILKQEEELSITSDYCIGLDWLGNSGQFVHVEPKINRSGTFHFNRCTESPETAISSTISTMSTVGDNSYSELDFIRMLLEVMSVEAAAKAATKLVQIDWNAKQISIEQQHDQLTPFLVVQFLQLLKGIVQKGLKKSYYKVQEHLTNRVKGKILVGQHIKQNVFRNRFTQTYCEYQVFGVDNTENRFLKKVLEFAVSYVENNAPVFQANKPAIAALISYCYAAFENIGDEILEYELKHFHSSPFFKEYKETIQIGRHILKRFSYTITHTSQRWIATPPFWIDMPELFELYVYAQMVKHNSLRTNDIHYQFSTYGNALDILVKDSDTSMVIDTKYKLHYQYGQIHDDIRQVSGYARLQAVRRQLNIENDRTIDCLIIYPDVESGITNLSFNSINRHRVEIPAYYRVYKLGIGLPVIGLYNCIP